MARFTALFTHEGSFIDIEVLGKLDDKHLASLCITYGIECLEDVPGDGGDKVLAADPDFKAQADEILTAMVKGRPDHFVAAIDRNNLETLNLYIPITDGVISFPVSVKYLVYLSNFSK